MWVLLWVAISIRSVMDLSFKAAVNRLHFDSIESVYTNSRILLKTPVFWLAGIVALINMILWCSVLTKFDLSYAYPLFSICYVIIILMGKVIYKEHLDVYKIVGIGLIALSSVVLALSH
jgi:multidrug transporter EmrE-like cation transporter